MASPFKNTYTVAVVKANGVLFDELDHISHVWVADDEIELDVENYKEESTWWTENLDAQWLPVLDAAVEAGIGTLRVIRSRSNEPFIY